MISDLENPWAKGWAEGHAPAKKQTVAEWSAENVYLANSPMGAKYQAGGHTDDILNDLQNPDVYESSAVGHTGMGKSAVLECAACYIIAQAPGPMLMLGHTKNTVRDWYETRGRVAFQKCEAVAKYLPSGKDRHKDRKEALIMPGRMDLLLGAANETDTQEKSMRYTTGDEPWEWKDGMIAELLARHHDRWNRKNLLVSQGGVEGTEWHTHTKNGLGFDRGFECPECGTDQVFRWRQVIYGTINPETGKREIPRDGNGDYDWLEIMPTVHYECENPDCGEHFEDTPRGRMRLTSKAKYICRNNAHIPGRITRYIPAMANPRIQLFTLVKQWLLAEDEWKAGNPIPRRQFIQKRLAQFWAEKPDLPTLNVSGEPYQKSQYNNGEKWDDEHARHFRIDVQKGHFWASIRSWKIGDGVKSRLLWEGKIDTWQGLFELQDRYGIEHRDVWIDGRYEIDEVVRQITLRCGPPTWDKIRRMWNFDNQWNILMGFDNVKGYQYEVGTTKRPRKVWKIFSKWQYGTTHRGQQFRCIHFSNLRAKDALSGLMGLQGGEFRIPVDVSKNYLAHMQSEIKREVSPGIFRWEKIKDHIRNDLWDTEVQGMVANAIRGIMKIEISDNVH